MNADGCELPCNCWELNSGPLEEQSVLLTTEPWLQPLVLILECSQQCFVSRTSQILVCWPQDRPGSREWLLCRVWEGRETTGALYGECTHYFSWNPCIYLFTSLLHVDLAVNNLALRSWLGGGGLSRWFPHLFQAYPPSFERCRRMSEVTPTLNQKGQGET